MGPAGERSPSRRSFLFSEASPDSALCPLSWQWAVNFPDHSIWTHLEQKIFQAGDPLGSSRNLETGMVGSEHGAMPSQPGCRQRWFEAFRTSAMQGTIALRMPHCSHRNDGSRGLHEVLATVFGPYTPLPAVDDVAVAIAATHPPSSPFRRSVLFSGAAAGNYKARSNFLGKSHDDDSRTCLGQEARSRRQRPRCGCCGVPSAVGHDHDAISSLTCRAKGGSIT